MRLLTERLELRAWTLSDADALVEGLNDLTVTRWLARVPHPYSRADAEGWVRYCGELLPVEQGGKSCEWAIELRGKGGALGGVSLERIDRFQGSAGGGVWINAQHAGHGYGQEAFAEKVRHAFEDLGLRRLKTDSLMETLPLGAFRSELAIGLRGESGRVFGAWPMDGSWMRLQRASYATNGGGWSHVSLLLERSRYPQYCLY